MNSPSNNPGINNKAKIKLISQKYFKGQQGAPICFLHFTYEYYKRLDWKRFNQYAKECSLLTFILFRRTTATPSIQHDESRAILSRK
jgi:hypothetical protein